MNIKINEINTISNYVSFFRILLGIPIFILISKLDQNDSYRIIIAALCILAWISDLLDGYLARKFNQISELGKIIDPLADKVLVIIIVVQLYLFDEIPFYYFIIIILRDILIFFGGIYVSNRIGKVIPSNLLGKITVLSIAAFILGTVLNISTIPWLYYSLLYLSLFLSFASVVGYAVRGIELIKWNKNEAI
jgi:cardiolipin synthase